MTHDQYNLFVQHFLTAVNYAAPNGKVQSAFSQLVRNINAETDVPDNDRARRIVGALYDGLAYGNWIGDMD